MKIPLTEKQIKQLTPFFDRVQATAALGKPGMLVAQIRWSSAERKYWMEPGFLPHENAKCIEEKGQACPPVPSPKEQRQSRVPRSAQIALGEPLNIGETVP